MPQQKEKLKKLYQFIQFWAFQVKYAIQSSRKHVKKGQAR